MAALAPSRSGVLAASGTAGAVGGGEGASDGGASDRSPGPACSSGEAEPSGEAIASLDGAVVVLCPGEGEALHPAAIRPAVITAAVSRRCLEIIPCPFLFARTIPSPVRRGALPTARL